jgi:hypothetical protein
MNRRYHFGPQREKEGRKESRKKKASISDFPRDVRKELRCLGTSGHGMDLE